MSVGEVQIVCNFGGEVVEAEANALVLTTQPNIITKTTINRAVPLRRVVSVPRVCFTTIDPLPIVRGCVLRRYRFR